ncbi:MAG: RNA 3'-phosphate cyclase [Thermoprotei archaeon]|nr:MAG: RNA 3'-phosphate cyclase [Thermoprotei archaeon]RLF00479.1 MAG: RNA 3'-phosphate cyclase [Thermoprotei archaeon]HDI75274.1 RNA 3'-terminal phosphate cyclase [Thermoprotei archaeon]
MSLIVIDGSMGEGGGQILRTAIALSALTLRPVKIINIRAKRSNPGLRPQHITGIKAVAALCGAEVKGLSVGSREIEFRPTARRAGVFRFDVGTAGSVSLVLQALLPVLALAPDPCELHITGGTDVSWSPPIDYVRFVLAPMLRKMGFFFDITVKKRGHYPKGGGYIICKSRPVADKLKAIRVLERGDLLEVQGISHCVRLPPHVARRQAESAKIFLAKRGITKVSIDLETYPPHKDPHLGPGSGIVLWAVCEKSILGADSLGAKGKPAETVGQEAASKLIEELETGRAVDRHMTDMLVPFMAIASGESAISSTKLTLHAETNIMLAKIMLGVDFNVERVDSGAVISVEGLGLERGV